MASIAAGACGALVASMVVTAAAAPSDVRVPPSPWLANLLEQSVTGTRAFTHLDAWQRIADANGGNRATDTRGFSQSRDYVIAQLQRAGYHVVRQPVPHPAYAIDAERIEESSPSPQPIRGLLARWSPSTPSGGIEAPVVAVPTQQGGQTNPTAGCKAEDYAGLSVQGAVALAPNGGCSFVTKQQVAASLGARAFLTYPVTVRPDNLYRFHVFTPASVTIPIATMTQRQGERLATESATSTVRLRLDLRAHTANISTENVFAETSGGNPDRVVMAGAHIDSVEEGPGINDNASSAAAVLETAIRLAPLQHRVTNKVRFAFWGAEEQIDIGSTYYVQHLDMGELDAIALYLNYELIGSPNFARFVMDGASSGPPGSATIQQVITDYYASRGLATEPSDIRNIGSDHEPFLAAGIPFGGTWGGSYHNKTADQAARFGGQAGDMYDPCYHQACDRTESIHRTEFDRNTRAIAWTIGRFALDLHDIP